MIKISISLSVILVKPTQLEVVGRVATGILIDKINLIPQGIQKNKLETQSGPRILGRLIAR